MEYAIIKTGGKQYKVSKNSVLEVERLPLEKGKNVIFDNVLLYVADGKIKIGKPKLAGASVKGTILEQTKGDKIRVSKFKAKARYRKTTGHRQALTKIKILDILTSVKN